MSESPANNPSSAGKDPVSQELQDILDRARADGNTPIKKVESSDELTYDPISDNRGAGMNSDNGVSIVHSFVNRTIFFDYFRHVAHKRFPEHPPEARVQALTEAEPGFYKRSIISDYVVKISTSAAILVIGGMIVVKAIVL